VISALYAGKMGVSMPSFVKTELAELDGRSSRTTPLGLRVTTRQRPHTGK